HAHEMDARELLRLSLPAREKELADPVQVLPGAWAMVLVGVAGPDRLLVELDPLVNRPPEDHGAQTAVADRQRFDPLARGSRVPERQRVRHALGREGPGRESGRGGEEEAEDEAGTVRDHRAGLGSAESRRAPADGVGVGIWVTG